MFRFRRLLLLLLFFCGLVLIQAELLSTAEAKDESYRNLELFTDVLAIIQKSYVEEVDVKELIYGGIRGMLGTLDPHSSFLSPEMYQDMKADTHGEFGGVGMEIVIRDGKLTVVAPIEGTPAYEAGIEAGDVIQSVDGQPVEKLELMQAVRKLRGAKGTAVTLTIWRESFEKPKTYTIIRDIIQIRSVKGRMLEPGYGYVRVSQFQEKTGTDLRRQLEALRAEPAAPFKGLILDLRNNPGGLLDQAVSVSDLFIDEGLIVYTEGRESGSQMRFTATAEGTEPAYPMVVLINGGSASASEIVAGALGDHGRAVILGERSFGKGSVQTIVPLSDNSGLRLTTARYFTPNGISIQAKGISPDIVVSALKLTQDDGVGQVRERDLEHHMERLQAEEESGREGEGATLSADDRLDYQLMRALDLLKGLEIMKTKTPSAA